jgi:hypothetical protein
MGKVIQMNQMMGEGCRDDFNPLRTLRQGLGLSERDAAGLCRLRVDRYLTLEDMPLNGIQGAARIERAVGCLVLLMVGYTARTGLELVG